MTKGQTVQATETTAPARRKTPKAAKPKGAKAAKRPGQQVALADPRRQALAAPSAPKTFMQVIAEAAGDPRVDVAKMQALLDMQKQIEERDAKKAFTQAFVLLQGELPVINRDGKIEVRKKDSTGERTGAVQQSTPYATYPAIMKVCKPILDKHGFTFSTRIRPKDDGRILVISTLRHISGHSDESEFPLPAETSGSKNNVQGWGSSQQYGMRYNAVALLNITTEAKEDLDTDGHQGTFQRTGDGSLAEKVVEPMKVTTGQRDKLIELMSAAGITEAQFCAKYRVSQVGFLPVDKYDLAVNEIAAHKASRG